MAAEMELLTGWYCADLEYQMYSQTRVHQHSLYTATTTAMGQEGGGGHILEYFQGIEELEVTFRGMNNCMRSYK